MPGSFFLSWAVAWDCLAQCDWQLTGYQANHRSISSFVRLHEFSKKKKKRIILVLWVLFLLCEAFSLAPLHSVMVSLQWNGSVTCSLRTALLDSLWIINANCSRFLGHGAFSCLYPCLLSCWLYPFLKHRRLSCFSFSASFSLKLCPLWLSYSADL